MITLHYIDVIILISACQSLFMAVLIIQKYWNSLPNRVLSLLFLSFALVLLQMLLWDMQYFTVSPRLIILLTGTAFLVGPLQYLYTLYLSHLSRQFKFSHLLHFIPFVLFELSMLPLLFTSEDKLIAGMSGNNPQDIPFVSLVFNWVVMVHIMIYTVLIFIEVNKYSKKIRNIFSNIEKIKLGWLRNSAALFSAGIIMYIIENSLITGKVMNNQYAISSLVAALFVYILGYLVLLKSEVFAAHEFTEQIDIDAVTGEEIKAEEHDKSSDRYKKSGLNDEKAKEYIARLLKTIDEQKPYLDSSLTLSKLAALVSIPPHHLSEIINVQLNKNFFDFINEYRVEKVKEDLRTREKHKFTLLAIAMDAGFNSKTSFNNIFKKNTGITPSEYRKKHS